MKPHQLKNNGWFLLLGLLILLSGCHRMNDIDYAQKIWAHKANDTLTAQTKQKLFPGMELDLVYSAYQDELFVGHEFYDTLQKLTFKQWMRALADPGTTRFWLDVKNLDTTNAEQISNLILAVTNTYGITSNVLVENPSHEALKIVKQKGLPVLLWVDNLYWWDNKDTALWLKITQEHIDQLHPDGLSCEYVLHPLLTNSFPNENIHYWHTPCEKTPENVAYDKKLAKEKNVKVILVDYDEPIEF